MSFENIDTGHSRRTAYRFIPVTVKLLCTLSMDFVKILNLNREKIHLSPVKILSRYKVGKIVFPAFKVEDPFFFGIPINFYFEEEKKCLERRY